MLRGWPAAVLGPVLALTLSCSREASQVRDSGLSYLPADAAFAASIDAVRLRQAPLYRNLEAGFGKDRGKWSEVKTFLLHLGIDPDKELRSVLFAYRGVTEAPGGWLVVLRGGFDTGRIEKGLRDPGARMSAEAYGWRTIYNLVQVPEIGDLSLAIVDGAAVALGRAGSLRKVLDVRDGTAPSLASNHEIKRLVLGMGPKAQIWAVLNGREVSRTLQERMQQTPDGVSISAVKNLSSVQTGFFSAFFSEDLVLAMDLETDTEVNARNLADALRGIIAFGKMGAAGKDPEAVKVMEAMRVGSEKSTLQVRMTLAGATVEKLRAKYGETPAASSPPSAAR